MGSAIVTEPESCMIRSTTDPRPLFLKGNGHARPRTRSPQWVWKLIALGALLVGCDDKTAPDRGPSEALQDPAPPSENTGGQAPTAPPEDPEKSEEELKEEAKKQAEPPPPHEGPWLWITRSSAAIYKAPKPARDEKVGYVKRGGQVPVLAGTVEGDDCPKGWLKVASGGFICSHVGTMDKDDKDVKFRPTQPDVKEILPYKYARNAKNGTPLYKSIPTRKQIHQYEPYLESAIKERERTEKAKKEDEKQMREAGLSLGGAAGRDEEKDIPLWEREEDLHEVTLEDLKKEGDDILSQRMMQGFYIAIDKTFQWDGRTWYKTTKGLVTPAERFWQTDGSDFQGVEVDGEKWKLPIGWVIGGRKSATSYEIDIESNKRTAKGEIPRFEAIQLKYAYHRIGDIDYFQMENGDWIRDAHIRMTTPGERPKEVGPNERWIDVDISEQTLVVFEGDRPVYATLISSGKESTVKEKDHRTPRGMWRVREKHIASTMDGDGSAAGDLPYSIEDVPYIMYFHKSYATHGAFWHRNYGIQMSHGCVNLAPLDAKWIFYYADPPVHEGFHGSWATDERPGSMVVVHD